MMIAFLLLTRVFTISMSIYYRLCRKFFYYSKFVFKFLKITCLRLVNKKCSCSILSNDRCFNMSMSVFYSRFLISVTSLVRWLFPPRPARPSWRHFSPMVCLLPTRTSTSSSTARSPQHQTCRSSWPCAYVHLSCAQDVSLRVSQQTLKSKGFVKEQFSWQHYFWTLTDNGIDHLRFDL